MNFIFWPHCSCPNGLVTSNMAPAHPHATGVAVYPALFFKLPGAIQMLKTDLWEKVSHMVTRNSHYVSEVENVVQSACDAYYSVRHLTQARVKWMTEHQMHFWWRDFLQIINLDCCKGCWQCMRVLLVGRSITDPNRDHLARTHERASYLFGTWRCFAMCVPH